MKFSSKHIFIYKNEDIEKLVLYISDNHLLEQFFYIRYWYGGPHIRIRYVGDWSVKIDEYVKKIEKTNLYNKKSYYEKHKFDGKNTNHLYSYEKLPWYLENSIHEIEYIPEIDRYGGLNYLKVCENNFILSTKFSIILIKYFSKNQMFFILCRIFNNLLSSNEKKLCSTYWETNYEFKINKNYLNLINRTYNKKEKDINNIISRLEQNKDFVELSNSFNRVKQENINILFSLLHMTANRLGITVFEEFTIYNVNGGNS